MRPFKFRLARVLHLRRLLEQEARGRYGTAESAAREGEARQQKAVDSVLAGLAEGRERRATEGVDPRTVILDDRALDQLREVLANQRVQAAKLRAEADAQRDAWSAAQADVESLKRLLGRDRERHRLAFEREEQQELDERALTRFGLKPSADPADDPEHGAFHPEGP